MNAILGNFHTCGPQNRIEHDLSVVVVLPTDVVMAPGEPEPPPSPRSLVSPSYVLSLPVGHRLAYRWVTTAGTVRALQGFGRRQVGENGSESSAILHETHVIIPFVIHTERLHAIPDGMHTRFEIGFQ